MHISNAQMCVCVVLLMIVSVEYLLSSKPFLRNRIARRKYSGLTMQNQMRMSQKAEIRSPDYGKTFCDSLWQLSSKFIHEAKIMIRN